MIEDSITIHDRYQVEIKLKFNQKKTNPDANWEIETFIFFPASFGVNEATFAKADFYKEIKNYIRLQAPAFLVENLFDEGQLYIDKLCASLEQATANETAPAPDLLIEEFKVLACAYEGALNNNFKCFKSESECRVSFPEYLQEMHRFLQEFRSRLQVKAGEHANVALQSLFRSVDEYLSSISEKHAFRTWEFCEKISDDSRGLVKRAAKDFLFIEDQYRRVMKYPLLIESETEEKFAYRQKMLKKAVWSVLYLQKAKHEQGVLLSQILYAIAAGVAMVFATATAFYYQALYGNFTTPFFVALVLGYMFKDRIKDGLRVAFVKNLLKRINDFRTDIIGGSGRTIGSFKERFCYIPEKSLETEIAHIRDRQPTLGLGEHEAKELIIAYRKQVTIYSEVFRQMYRKLESPGVVDITRFNILPFIGKMDDPDGYGYIIENDTCVRHKCPRVYHMNFVVRYRMAKLENRVRRFRLIVNRKGILRIEKL